MSDMITCIAWIDHQMYKIVGASRKYDMNVSILFRPKNRVRGKFFRTFRESFSNFSPSRKFFWRSKFFSKFSWQRCDSFGPKIVKIGAILTVFRPFEISRKFCPVRAPSKFSMRIQNRNGHMCCHLDALQAMPPVNFRQVARDFHSVAKHASFYIAFGTDFQGFGRPKWTPKFGFRGFFFRHHFSMRLSIHFVWIFGGSEPEK